MLRKKLILSLFLWAGFLLNPSLCETFKNTKVMLHVRKSFQHDTLGTNLVEHFPPLVYTQIMNGNATLWDSPDKQIKLSPSTLLSLENNSATSFNFCDEFFMLETWSITQKSIKISSIGFYFINKNKNGEKVIYGFVEFEGVANAMKYNLVNVNADGFINTSFWDIFRNRRFDYNLVQFGIEKITDYTQSNIIKKEAFHNKDIYYNEELYKIGSQTKSVCYSLVKPMKNDTISVLNKNTEELLLGIESYLNSNQEEFYNIGGYQVQSHLKKNSKFKVTKVDVKSIWLRENTDSIKYEPLQIIIWINDSVPLNEMSFREFESWEILSGENKLSDLILKKNLYFTITKINDQDINPQYAKKYMEALINYHWSRMSEYVLFY